MKNKPVSNRMYSLLVLYDMHTKFLYSAIDGIADKDAQNRLQTKANHIAWLTGSIVQERYELAQHFGLQERTFSNELFKNHQGIQEDVIYPILADFKKDWATISPLLREALINLTDEKLDSIFVMPEMRISHFDYITFMIYREANCIGQIALWRRLLGYEAMKYM